MKIKGSAKVMLFDAKTGELTDCIESDNIVTNFFDVIFGDNLQRIVRVAKNYAGTSAGIFVLDNLVTDLFGGVMVFSQPIDESQDHVYPTFAEANTMIGNANQTQSITGSIYKGSVNGTETVITDRYATLVWDFSTSQCNGDIAAICLTSNKGGHLGCKFNVKDDMSGSMCSMLDVSSIGSKFWKLVSSTVDTTPKTISNLPGSLVELECPGAVETGNPALFVENDDYFRARIGKQLIGWNKDYIPDDVIDLYLNKGTGAFVIPAEISTSSDATLGDIIHSLNKDVAVSRTITKRLTCTVYRYTGDLSVVPQGVNVPLTNITASIRTFFNLSTSYNVIDNYYSLRWFYNNKFIMVVGSLNNPSAVNANTLRCYLLNLDGSFVYHDTTFTADMVTTLVGSSTLSARYDTYGIGSFTIIDDELYLCLGVSNNGFNLLHIDKDTGEIASTPTFSLGYALDSPIEDYRRSETASFIFDSNNTLTKKPFYTLSRCGALSMSVLATTDHMKRRNFGAVMMMNYLATINNMDTVLTKTADKTMKIVYTLTQV